MGLIFLRFLSFGRPVYQNAEARRECWLDKQPRSSGPGAGEIRFWKLPNCALRPVVDNVFPFDQTPEALAYVETGRAKGKVVIKVLWRRLASGWEVQPPA